MKKIKRIIAIIVAIVTMLMMATVANAGSFSGKQSGYNVSGSFNVTVGYASAEMSAHYVSGEIVEFPTCRIDGVVTTNSPLNSEVPIIGSSDGLSCSSSRNFNGTPTGGYCNFYFCSVRVGYVPAL